LHSTGKILLKFDFSLSLPLEHNSWISTLGFWTFFGNR